MNQRLLASIGVVFTLLAIAPVQAADDAMTIVDKAIKARGGTDHLAKVKGEQWKGKGTIDIMGMKMAYTADYTVQMPFLFRMDINMEFGGMKIVMSAATDGKKAWEKMGDDLRDIEGKKLQAFLHNNYAMTLGQLLPLKEKDYTLAVVDEIKIDDKPAVGVKVSKKGRPDVTLWFDKASGLLVKYGTIIWDEFTDKDVPQEVFMRDYQKKDGHLYFNKMNIKRDGKLFIEEEFSEQKQVDKLDPKVFAKPQIVEKKP